MNPLSPLTYYLRHKKSALVQIALISLATIGLFVLVAVLDVMPERGKVSYLTKMSRVSPAGSALDPGVVAQLQTHPDVARVIPDNGLPISAPTLIGQDSLRLLGVSPVHAQGLMQHCGVRLKAGRMFQPHSNEIVLSEETARALQVQLGDEISRAVDKTYYGAIATPLVVVGLLESADADQGPSVRLGFASFEYLDSHEAFAPRSVGMIVIAKPGCKATVDAFLETDIATQYTYVETYAEIARFVKLGHLMLYIWLIGCTMKETGSVTALAWLIGAGACGIGLLGMQALLYTPRGLNLDFLNLTPWLFTTPLPISIVLASAMTIARMLRNLDPVTVIERRI
jgi:hypothetical protein